MIILEAATATVAVVVTLTAYTFWAARRGEDFGFLAPFLLTLVVTIILFIIYMVSSRVFIKYKVKILSFNSALSICVRVHADFQVLPILQIFFPVGKISYMLYNGLFVLVFSVYIIFDTNVLIKRNTYDEYIWASVMIYLDVLNIFLRLLRIFAAANRR